MWFNSLLASAGGSVITGQGDDAEVALGQPAIDAMEVMRGVATSQAADPSLSNAQEDDGRLAFETGNSTFMINYPFVYPSARRTLPRSSRTWDGPAGPRWSLASPAARRSVASPRHRRLLRAPRPGVRGGHLHPLGRAPDRGCHRGGPAADHRRLYDDPGLREVYPFADVVRASLEDAAPRPVSPAYSDISLAIQRSLHPPDRIDPQADLADLEDMVNKALDSRGLL